MPTKARYGATVAVRVIGAAPESTVVMTASTGQSQTFVSTGAALSIPLMISDPDGVDWSVSVNGVDIAGDFITAVNVPSR